MINKKYPGINKVTGRKELKFSIHCAKCNKHMADSEWEMENKLCHVCSGWYDRMLLHYGLKPKMKNVQQVKN